MRARSAAARVAGPRPLLPHGAAGRRGDPPVPGTVLTTQDAEQIVNWIQATGKNLTTIYITHGHGDHFFGLNPILSVFEQSQEASP